MLPTLKFNLLGSPPVLGYKICEPGCELQWFWLINRTRECLYYDRGTIQRWFYSIHAAETLKAKTTARNSELVLVEIRDPNFPWPSKEDIARVILEGLDEHGAAYLRARGFKVPPNL